MKKLDPEVTRIERVWSVNYRSYCSNCRVYLAPRKS